jgi:hypothetical protein
MVIAIGHRWLWVPEMWPKLLTEIFETGFLCCKKPGCPRLALWTRLAWNAQRSKCLCLLSAGIRELHHLVRLNGLPELLSPPARTHSGQPESSAAKLYCLLLRKTPNPENGAAYIARSVTFQHLMWHDSSWFIASPSPHYYALRWAVTRSEFTLAPAFKACLLVRHSGGQRPLIMEIAHGTPGSPQRLLTARLSTTL